MGFNVRKSMGVTTVVTKGEGFGRDFCGVVNGLREEEGESFVSSMASERKDVFERRKE